MSSADYFIPGVQGTYVWGKLIEELAEIGYDESNLHLAGYDWRLSPQELQKRDHYLSALKGRIELLAEANEGRRVVIVTHSMGGNLFFYFMNWVEASVEEGGGGGGKGWCDKHLHTFVNIGVPWVGTP